MNSLGRYNHNQVFKVDTLINGTNQLHEPPDMRYDTIPVIFLPKIHYQNLIVRRQYMDPSRGIFYKIPFVDFTLLFKNVKVRKEKERLKNYPRLKGTKEILRAQCCQWLLISFWLGKQALFFMIKDIIGIVSEIWIRPIDFIILLSILISWFW